MTCYAVQPGCSGELVRGELHRTMPTGREHGELVVNIGYLLGTFVKPRRLGVLFGSDSGVWLERDPDTVREPDIGFVSRDKAPYGVRVTGYEEEVPDWWSRWCLRVTAPGRPTRGR